MSKFRPISILSAIIPSLIIFLISLLLQSPPAQAAKNLPPSPVLFPAQQQDEEPEERTARLGENRGEVKQGKSEIWTYQGQAGKALTIKAQYDDAAAQCEFGVESLFSDKILLALFLLEAGFAGREEAIFTNPDDEGRCALVLGMLRYHIGNHSGAFEAFQVALEIFQASGNREEESNTLNSIGEIYRARGQYDLALKQYNLALVIMREVGDRAGEGIILNNIGSVYDNQGKYEEALEQFLLVLEIMREVGNRSLEGTMVNNIGAIYLDQAQYKLALKQFKLALEVSREVGDRAREGASLSNIGLR